MHPFPHRYVVRASGSESGNVQVSSSGLQDLETSAPPEFDGPEGFWSPESLLVAAVADCYVLSFRAVARASRLKWQSLAVGVEGVLDRVDGVTRFTAFTVKPELTLGSAEQEGLARTVLEKSERACLVTNSMKAASALEPVVRIVEPQARM